VPAPESVLAETAGTAALLAIVVGSGIMGEALAPNLPGVALLANAAATAAGLYVLISTLGPISGAHFNPCVTGLMWATGKIDATTAAAYSASQVVGALLGVLLAHAMFDLEWLQWGTKVRAGSGQWLSEAVATGGLLSTIVLAQRQPGAPVAGLVASYIFAAYWFTASTSFANPAVTIARAFTDTFAAIRLADVPGFLIAQALGAAVVLSGIRYRQRWNRMEASDRW
jgi:glycerol uptake facilitator-like aquaporin